MAAPAPPERRSPGGVTHQPIARPERRRQRSTAVMPGSHALAPAPWQKASFNGQALLYLPARTFYPARIP